MCWLLVFYYTEGRFKVIKPLIECPEFQIFNAAWRGNQFDVLNTVLNILSV